MQKLKINQANLRSVLLANRSLPMQFLFIKKNGKERKLHGIIEPQQPEHKDDKHLLVRDFEENLGYRSIIADTIKSVVINNALEIEIV